MPNPTPGLPTPGHPTPGRLGLTRRDPEEHHRVATTLELFFDLATVIAIAACAAGLHHAVAHGDYGEGLVTFLLAFFGIWWAWMNWTWFSSAYDDGSALFRLPSFALMSGAVVIAAGIEEFFAEHRLNLVLAGYLVMRLGMVGLWLAAAAGDPGHRPTALRYAAGIAVAQLLWVLLILGYGHWGPLFALLFLGCGLVEMAVPFWAERAGMTPWHRHHMIERYGLLTIIVLGESLLSVAMALQGLAAPGGFDPALLLLAISALVVTFSLWGVYFTREDHLASRRHADAFAWGYGHALIFASGAAAGAGTAAMADILAHRAHAPLLAGEIAMALPVALFLAGLWAVRDRHIASGRARAILPVGALLCLATPLLPATPVPLAPPALALVALATALARRRTT